MFKFEPYQFTGCNITQAFYVKIRYCDAKKETYVIIHDDARIPQHDGSTYRWTICADTVEAVKLVHQLTN